VLVVLEFARRATGWGLVAVVLLALCYAVAGPYLPGFLAHRGYGFSRLIEHLYLSTEGIWGVPLGVSADFVYLFVLFGSVLDMAGEERSSSVWRILWRAEPGAVQPRPRLWPVHSWDPSPGAQSPTW